MFSKSMLCNVLKLNREVLIYYSSDWAIKLISGIGNLETDQVSYNP